jgi:signal transduction histidine kinase
VTYADRDNSLTDELDNLRLVLFLYIPVALLLSIIAGYFLSGFLLRPINTIARRADEIRLHERITLLQEPGSRDELHYLTVVLNRMLERIGRQSDQQHAFFASASHELRTPLSVMLTGLESILRTDLPAQPRELLQGQLEEVKRMSRLVNDFLLMSRLKSGELIPQKTPVNLAEITLDCIQQMQRRSRQKQQTFRVNLRPVDAGFMALADPAHLRVVIVNLVENAVKHGREKDTIVVELSILPAGSPEGGVCFSISNVTEPPAGDVAEWKEEFRRQDALKEGLGLGLFIVDQLVQKNNGRLTLDYTAPHFIARVALPAPV